MKILERLSIFSSPWPCYVADASPLIIESGAGFDDEKSLLMSQMSLEKRFGQSAVFVASTLMENGGVPQSATPETLLKEAIHVISCGYEDKTEWGSEVGGLYSIWIYVALNTTYSPVLLIP